MPVSVLKTQLRLGRLPGPAQVYFTLKTKGVFRIPERKNGLKGDS